jgi:hypothetical protein
VAYLPLPQIFCKMSDWNQDHPCNAALEPEESACVQVMPRQMQKGCICPFTGFTGSFSDIRAIFFQIVLLSIAY